MKDASDTRQRWQIADLLDFEWLLAVEDTNHADDAARERALFQRDIRPALAGLPEAEQRRVGLRRWLASRRAVSEEAGHSDRVDVWPGTAWLRGLSLTRWLLFVVSAISGAGLAFGLCLGAGQRVHVVIFIACTLILPWLFFVAALVARRVAGNQWVAVRVTLALLGRLLASQQTADAARQRARLQALGRALRGSRAATTALSARLGSIFQLGSMGFSLGVVLAFVTTLMLFDVRFYWEATPEDDAFMQTAVAGLSLPWAAAWPLAAPTDQIVRASRLRRGADTAIAPGGVAAASWWRFLVMSVLVWGVLPRVLLLGWYRWRERHALGALDFQAPRHRALWRQLAGIERGRTADAAADAALVLDIGGNGMNGEALRGFMLRKLRLNPQATHRVSVLDDAAEAAADQALSKSPVHVVLVALDWALSPRQAAALQQRVRRLAGADTPITWVVAGGSAQQPAAPSADDGQRWTRFIDGLGDPATEIAAYDPSA